MEFQRTISNNFKCACSRMVECSQNVLSLILMSWNITRQYSLSLNESVVLLLAFTEVSSHRAIPWRQLPFASTKLHWCTLGKSLSCSHSWGKRVESVNKRKRGTYEASSYCLLCWSHFITCASLCCWPSSIFIDSDIFFCLIYYTEGSAVEKCLLSNWG